MYYDAIISTSITNIVASLRVYTYTYVCVCIYIYIERET